MRHPDVNEPLRRKPMPMSGAMLEKPPDMDTEKAQLHDQLGCLRVENARLQSANRELRVALDAHIARAASTPLYGPLEMTAGTCIGPRRRRGPSRERRSG